MRFVALHRCSEGSRLERRLENFCRRAGGTPMVICPGHAPPQVGWSLQLQFEHKGAK